MSTSTMEEAIAVLLDCIVCGDNREYALAMVANDYEVEPAALAKAFEWFYGSSHLSYNP